MIKIHIFTVLILLWFFFISIHHKKLNSILLLSFELIFQISIIMLEDVIFDMYVLLFTVTCLSITSLLCLWNQLGIDKYLIDIHLVWLVSLSVICITLQLEVDWNWNTTTGTRNLPGIWLLVLVPGFRNFDFPVYWFVYWFLKISFFLGEPGSSGLLTGQTRKLLVWTRSSWVTRMFLF
jgi:hypothetical protein